MLAVMEQKEKEEFLSEIGNLFERQVGHLADVVTKHYDDKIELVMKQLTDLREEFNDMKRVLNSHTEMIGELVVDMAIVRTDIGAIRAELDTKADTRDVVVLNGRVSALEARKL